MVVSTNDILAWCGINTGARRATVIEDLMPAPEGLFHLSNETEEALKDACEAYAKRQAQPLMLTRAIVKIPDVLGTRLGLIGQGT